MRKKSFTLLLGMLAMACQAFALEGGDYVYTQDARYKVSLESENLVVNGYFTETDYTSANFGWTDADGGFLGTLMSIEPAAGPNGENVIYSISTSGSMMQSVAYEGGKQYVITMKVKGPSAAATYYGQSTSNNFIDVYAVKDVSGDLDDDNNYQTIASYSAISQSWGDITFAFADESGEDGYIVILIKSLTEETLIGNFEIREATQVGDDREVNALLENAQLLIASGEFASDNNGYAEAVEGVYYSALEDPTIWDDIDNANSLVTELSSMQDIWMDESSSDMSDYFSKFDITTMSKWNSGYYDSSYSGDWILTGNSAARWGHGSGSAYLSYAFPATYTLGWGQATLTQSGMPAGRYMFAVDVNATKYTRAYNASGSSDTYLVDYSYYVTDSAYIFFGDTKLYIDTLDNYGYKTYYLFGDLAEGDTLKAGAYFPGFSSGGGAFHVGYAQLRLIGTSAEDAINQAYLESIITQQNALLASITSATAELNTKLWGNDSLQTAIDIYTAYYNSTLTYVTADGELATDITFDNLPEDYDDLISGYEDGMEKVRSYYSSLNEPYYDLIELVATAQSYLDNEAMAGASATTRSALQTEVDESNALIAAVTSEEQTDEFEAAYDELTLAIQEFRFSCASFEYPGEIIYTNAAFELKNYTGWDVTAESGSGAWSYGADSRFSGGYKISVWRGSTAFPKNKVRREVTITEPGVYEFQCEAYCMNHNATYYNAMWNGLTGEDSVRSANVNIFFGLLDEPTKVNCLTQQWNLSSSYVTYDELRTFAIQYVKTTASSVEETLEFGFDALSNGLDEDGESLGYGANSYGFGSTHVYYYGTEDTYADGISAAKAEEIQADDYVYSISGVRMGKASDNLPKGVYIAKGKKFIVK